MRIVDCILRATVSIGLRVSLGAEGQSYWRRLELRHSLRKRSSSIASVQCVSFSIAMHRLQASRAEGMQMPIIL
jgi:hypothetical protein